MTNHLRTLNERLLIKGTITPLTALHIGSQRSYDPVESDSPVIKDPTGSPIIPGSSFKGILRGFMEGFLSGAGINDCFSTEGDPGWCIDRAVYNKKKENKKGEEEPYVLENSCPICKMLGSPYIGGKVKIKDMPVNQDAWHETFLKTRDGVTIDRESRTAKDRAKYDFETVSPGIPFQLELMADNLDDNEKGILFLALDLISQGFASLGGNVSRGTGRINIHIERIDRLEPANFFKKFKKDKTQLGPEVLEGQELTDFLTQVKEKYMNSNSHGEVNHV